jgi:hypothetical protein
MPTRPTGAARLRDREVEAGEHRAGVLREGPSRLGRRDDAARPPEQLDAELLLEPANRLRQRRLRDVQPLGRPPEVQLLEDGEEVAEMAQLDRGRAAGAGSRVRALCVGSIEFACHQ